MKKVFLAFLLVLFATAAYAEVKFEVSGDFWGRGSYWWNQNYLGQAQGDANVNYGFYDGALDLYPRLILDNTSINMMIVMRKEVWGQDTVKDTEGILGPGTSDESGNNFNREYDGRRMESNISVERLWLTHKFNENSTLEVGLVDGQCWGTTFADYQVPRYRVMYIQKTPVGAVGGLIEKDAEEGTEYTKHSNWDDHNVYALFGVTKAANVWIKPLLYYVDRSSLVADNGTDGVKLYNPELALMGDLGVASFEAELDYEYYNFTGVAETTEKNAKVWGAYLNVFKALDFGKPGIKMAYGSWDTSSGPAGKAGGGWGFDFKNDFKSNLIIGGQGVKNADVPGITLGSIKAYASAKALSPALPAGTYVNPVELGIAKSIFLYKSGDLTGFTLIKPYIDDINTPIKGLTCSASASYMFSNQKDTEWDGAKAYEVDLGTAYKITDNLVYSIDAGYAKIKDLQTWTVKVPAGTYGATQPNLYQLTDLDNPDPIYLVQHKIEFKF